MWDEISLFSFLDWLVWIWPGCHTLWVRVQFLYVAWLLSVHSVSHKHWEKYWVYKDTWNTLHVLREIMVWQTRHPPILQFPGYLFVYYGRDGYLALWEHVVLEIKATPHFHGLQDPSALGFGSPCNLISHSPHTHCSAGALAIPHPWGANCPRSRQKGSALSVSIFITCTSNSEQCQ